MYSHSPYQRRWMRCPDGLVFGVCSGLAKRLGVSSFIIRLVTFIAFCLTGFFPVGLIYGLLALLLPLGPEYCN